MAKQRQRQSRYVHILIILLGLMGGYMYNTTFATDTASSDDDITSLSLAPEFGNMNSSGTGLEQFANKSFDLSVLEDSQYQLLQIIGNPKINQGITGRTDIFAPF